MGHIAHSLKGLGGNIGAHGLRALAGRIEQHLRASHGGVPCPIQDAHELADMLERALEE